MTEKNETVTDSSSKCYSLVLETPSRKPKRTKSSIQFDPLPVLPHEIIAEILSRLPVKTLLRFRCVSKSFKTLISDPHFIRTHLRNITSLPNKPNLHQKIVLNWYDTRWTLKTFSLYSICDNSQTDAVDLVDYSLVTEGYVVGTCDGLICLARKRGIVIVVNPSTRVISRLPDLSFRKELELKGVTYGSERITYGFGYDSKINDYKVVALYDSFGGVEREIIVKVCNLKSRCWRRIKSFPYGLLHRSGAYVNGSLNWALVSGSNVRIIWTIVSLDLASETYKEVNQPDYGDLSYSGQTLGVLDGCLCIMCNYFPDRADIWVMKEHGVGDSWIKYVSIPYLDSRCSYYTGPFYIAHNGEVLVKLGSAFVVFNPKDGTCRYSRINSLGGCYWDAVGTYIESMVLPGLENLRPLETRRTSYLREL